MSPKKLICVSVLVGVAVVAFFSTTAIASSYRYPAPFGSDEWKRMDNEHKILASNVPEEILKSADTPQLIDICLDNPLVQNIITFEDFQKSMRFLEENVNCFAALVARQDAGSCLMLKYDDISTTQTDSSDTVLTRVKARMKVSLVELLLAQPEVLSTLNTSDLDTLLNRCAGLGATRTVRTRFGADIFSLLVGRILVTIDNRKTLEGSVLSSGARDYIAGRNRYSREIGDEIFRALAVYTKH